MIKIEIHNADGIGIAAEQKHIDEGKTWTIKEKEDTFLCITNGQEAIHIKRMNDGRLINEDGHLWYEVLEVHYDENGDIDKTKNIGYLPPFAI